MTGSQGAGFDVLLLCHVACVALGLGAVVVSGIQGLRLRRGLRAGAVPAAVRRYFEPGTDWVSRLLYGVPLFGFGLLATSKGVYGFDDLWVDLGLILAVLVLVVGEAALWPAERRLKAQWRATPDPLAEGAPGGEAMVTQATVVLLAASLMVGGLGAAVVLMVVRP